MDGGRQSQRPTSLEATGIGLVTGGIHELCQPASFILAGAALVFVAQGLERDL